MTMTSNSEPHVTFFKGMKTYNIINTVIFYIHVSFSLNVTFSFVDELHVM